MIDWNTPDRIDHLIKFKELLLNSCNFYQLVNKILNCWFYFHLFSLLKSRLRPTIQHIICIGQLDSIIMLQIIFVVLSQTKIQTKMQTIDITVFKYFFNVSSEFVLIILAINWCNRYKRPIEPALNTRSNHHLAIKFCNWYTFKHLCSSLWENRRKKNAAGTKTLILR